MLTFAPLRHVFVRPTQCLCRCTWRLEIVFHCLLQVHSLYTKEVFTFKYSKPILVGSLLSATRSACAELPRFWHQLRLH